MNLFRGNNIRRAIVGRGLVHSLFIYSVGIIVMVAVLYTGLMNYSSESGSSLAFQTSTAILPDLQDKNYYAIKRSFDQLVSSSDLKGVAISDLNNKIFTKSGYWNDEMSDLIETTDLLTVNDVYIFNPAAQ